MKKKKKIPAILCVSTLSAILIFAKKEDLSLAFHTSNITTSIFQMDKGEEIATIIEETLNENESFQKVMNERYLYTFTDYLGSYFKEFGKFYSVEQIKRGKEAIEKAKEYEYTECYENILYSAIKKEDSIDGLTYAYVQSVVNAYCNRRNTSGLLTLDLCFENLTAYLPPDVVASHIINNDIEGLSQELKECYCLADTKELEEIISLYDNFYNVYFDKNNLAQKEQLEEIEMQIEDLQKGLLRSKLENDSEFINTFGGQIASNYANGKEDYFCYTYPNGSKPYCGIDISYITGQEYSNLHIEGVNINSKTTYEEAIHQQALNVLSSEMNKNYYTFLGNKISYLLDTEDYSPYSNILIINLTNKYPEYFLSIEETEEFIVALYDKNPETLDKYLRLLEKKWLSTPITIEMAAEIRSFSSDFINDYYFLARECRITRDEEQRFLGVVKKGDMATNYDIKEEETSRLGDWYDRDSLVAFINKMEEYVKKNTEEFSYIAPFPYSLRSTITLEKVLVEDNELYVYSKEIGAQVIYEEGKYMVFVSIPKNYETGTLLYFTEDMFGQKEEQELPFLLFENEDGLIAIISISKDRPSISNRNYYFKTTYDHIRSTEENIELKLQNEE